MGSLSSIFPITLCQTATYITVSLPPLKLHKTLGIALWLIESPVGPSLLSRPNHSQRLSKQEQEMLGRPVLAREGSPIRPSEQLLDTRGRAQWRCNP